MCPDKESLPMLFDTLKKILTYYKSTLSAIIGMWMVNEHYLDPGLDLRDSQMCTKLHSTERFKVRPGLMTVGRMYMSKKKRDAR